MTEQQSTPYEFQNPHKITLAYTGIASDIIELDDPTADGYMGVTDARSDIIIEQSQPSRVYDYEGRSAVKVAKILELPRIELPNHKPHYSTELDEEGTHVIRINDQSLARQVTDKGFEKGTYDEQFVTAFRNTIKSALKDCLTKEKLLNNGQYNVDFFNSQIGLIVLDGFVVPAAVGLFALSGEPIEAVQVGTVLWVTSNVTIHILKIGDMIKGKMNEWMDGSYWEKNFPHILRNGKPEDPFMRQYLKKPWEMLLPPVPVDRLARGILYLHQHGNELIRLEKESV